MLNLINVSKTYQQPDGDVQVLSGLHFTLPAGSSAALLGESGSGKTTLLHLVAGLDTPDSGQIRLNGSLTENFSSRDWNQVRRNQLSLVFQQFHLIPTLTVEDNIFLQARLSGQRNDKLAGQLIDRLGLRSLLGRLPHQLSGGQQQRVAIARSLIHQPGLVLADEPTGNLDESTSSEVMEIFVELVREAGSSLLMVTHSRTMASYLDSQWLLQKGIVSDITWKSDTGDHE